MTQALPPTHRGDLRAQDHPRAAPEGRPLTLFVRGFQSMERQLLAGTVRLSQRRNPRLEHVLENEAASADVVMIDALDPSAMEWSQNNDWLRDKVVIWVDAQTVPAGHTAIRRPVQWPTLPMLLARALEQGPVHTLTEAGAPGPSTPSGTRSARLATVGGRVPVLVVDDSLAVRAHMRALLEPRGFAVTEADTAEAGIRTAAQSRFSCILMDVLMPGMDGYEACRRIKGDARPGARPAVLMLTSKSSPFDRIRGKMAGCDAYLTKPVDPDDLYEALGRLAVAPEAGGRPWTTGDSAAGTLATPAALNHASALTRR